MDDGLAEQLEAGKVDPNWEKKKLGRFFQNKYKWDLLSSRSVRVRVRPRTERMEGMQVFIRTC